MAGLMVCGETLGEERLLSPQSGQEGPQRVRQVSQMNAPANKIPLVQRRGRKGGCARQHEQPKHGKEVIPSGCTEKTEGKDYRKSGCMQPLFPP